MRTKMKKAEQRIDALERVLDAVGQEMIDCPEEELLDAARDLGMDPMSKGSAAFIGLKYPAVPRLDDFFEIRTRPDHVGRARISPSSPMSGRTQSRRKKKSEPSDDREK